jgi:hypothetical protein
MIGRFQRLSISAFKISATLPFSLSSAGCTFEFLLLTLKLAHCPHSLAACLAALPSMSLIPFVSFFRTQSRTTPD